MNKKYIVIIGLVIIIISVIIIVRPKNKKEENLKNDIVYESNPEYPDLKYNYDDKEKRYIIYDEEDNIRGYAKDEMELKIFYDNPDYDLDDMFSEEEVIPQY